MITMKCFLVLLLALLPYVHGQDDDFEMPDFGWENVTALDEYVWADDGAFSYEHLATYNYEGVRLYIYNMTSQYYLEEGMTSHHLWWHNVGCAFPDNAKFDDAAWLFLAGGNNKDPDEYPLEDDLESIAMAAFANNTGIAGCFIGQVINGPIIYANDPEQRELSGDPQIAWTFRSYLDMPEWSGPSILSRFPMTKSAKRGLDTMLAVALEQEGMAIEKVMVTGPSKWGWTTWSHFATDPRVNAITPIVFSFMNWPETVMDHYQALDGAYSFALDPYWHENLTQAMTTPEALTLLPYEDMYCYRSRYVDRPVLAISATGDEYFFPQDFHNWWDDFPEPKWLMMVPNAEHILFPHYDDIFANINAFWTAILGGHVDDLPTVSWTRESNAVDGTIVMNVSKAPSKIRAMRAVTLTNDTRRDFRLIAGYPDQSLHPVWWRDTDIGLEVSNDNLTITHRTLSFEDEWVGHMIEVTYDYEDDVLETPLIFTTEVNFVPDQFPHAPCESPEECYGYLV